MLPTESLNLSISYSQPNNERLLILGVVGRLIDFQEAGETSVFQGGEIGFPVGVNIGVANDEVGEPFIDGGVNRGL